MRFLTSEDEGNVKAVLKPRIELEGRTPLETVIPLETPFILFVDPASACNLKCNFCPTGHFEFPEIAGRFNGIMKLPLFKKIIEDLTEFEKPIKVLRLYKDGEPGLNKYMPDMVRYAKVGGCVDFIDTTTNGLLLEPRRLGPVLEAGINKINVSVDGMNPETYKRITGVNFDFDGFVANVKWAYANRGSCELVVKSVSDILTADEQRQFFDTFGDICDRISLDNIAPCWPEFDVEKHTGVKITKGIYQQEIGDTDVCPYIFYSMSVNADGQVSSCFVDWGRKLIIGDVSTESLRAIWNSDRMNALRLLHLEGKRKGHQVCGSCGQLSHCLPDNIDAHRVELLDRMRRRVAEKDA